jgi:NADH:ubiquinone oxidoreductase subunit 4 (subunit M)
MNSKVYDFLRWFSSIFLPALTTFIGVLLTSLHVQYAETVVTIMAAFTTFMNAIVGVSKVTYDNKQKAELDAFVKKQEQEGQ